MISFFYNCIKLCRFHHAVKNLLILFPPFFGHKLFEKGILLSGLFALISFTLIASIVYILNDLADVEKDRQHPKKRLRTIASGKVSKLTATGLIITLLASGIGLMLLSQNFTAVVSLATGYLLLNIVYSFKFKNYALFDIFILALGFVLRVYFGGVWFNVEISPWLFLCVLCGALCFATGKRRNEMLHATGDYSSRPVLKKYDLAYLTNTYYLFCGITIVFFSLWTIIAVHSKPILQFTIPLVIFIMLRYNLIIETAKTDGDPIPTLLHDKILISLVLIFGIMSFLGLYF